MINKPKRVLDEFTAANGSNVHICVQPSSMYSRTDALTCHEIDFYLTGQIHTCGM